MARGEKSPDDEEEAMISSPPSFHEGMLHALGTPGRTFQFYGEALKYYTLHPHEGAMGILEGSKK